MAIQFKSLGGSPEIGAAANAGAPERKSALAAANVSLTRSKLLIFNFLQKLGVEPIERRVCPYNVDAGQNECRKDDRDPNWNTVCNDASTNGSTKKARRKSDKQYKSEVYN